MAVPTHIHSSIPAVAVTTAINDGITTMDPIYVGSDDNCAQIDGLELSDAARVLCVSIDELWRRIKNGALVARTVLGKVYVYTDLPQMSADVPLPPPPSVMETRDHAVTFHREVLQPQLNDPNQLALIRSGASDLMEVSGNNDLALLIDHLSLAKEENREILRLTQDSMARLTQMTDSILEMKDSIITAKEEQLAIMKERLTEQAKELSHALKEKENLETLVRAIQL